MGTNTRRWALLSGVLLVAVMGFLAVAPRAGAADDDDDKAPWLGVYTQSLDEDLREGLNYNGDGVLVNRVIDDGPAKKAGVRKGDLIVRFNNREVDSPDELADLVRDSRVGQRVSIQVIRDGQRRTINVTLGEREYSRGNAWYWDDDDDGDVRVRVPRATRVHVNRHWTPHSDVRVIHAGRPMLGVRVHYLEDNPDLASYFGASKGALVLEVTEESAAEKAGIKAGDVITKVGDREIEDSNDIIRELRDHEDGDEVGVTVVRKGQSMQLKAKLEDSQFGYWQGGDGDQFVFKGLDDLDDLVDLEELRNLGEKIREKQWEVRERNQDAERELRELRREMRELQRRLNELEDK